MWEYTHQTMPSQDKPEKEVGRPLELSEGPLWERGLEWLWKLSIVASLQIKYLKNSRF